MLLFRNGAEWAEAAGAGWDVLLEPSLAGQVILPASPRWVIDLLDRCGGDAALQRLRQQLLTMDDRRATNLVAQGQGPGCAASATLHVSAAP